MRVDADRGDVDAFASHEAEDIGAELVATESGHPACTMSNMDAVFPKTGRIDARIMARQARLRIIARHGVGLDELGLDSIRAAGMPVSTTPGVNSNAVAEATVGLALSVLRHLPRGSSILHRRLRSYKRP